MIFEVQIFRRRAGLKMLNALYDMTNIDIDFEKETVKVAPKKNERKKVAQ